MPAPRACGISARLRAAVWRGRARAEKRPTPRRAGRVRDTLRNGATLQAGRARDLAPGYVEARGPGKRAPHF
jgi:hypothetical protein